MKAASILLTLCIVLLTTHTRAQVRHRYFVSYVKGNVQRPSGKGDGLLVTIKPGDEIFVLRDSLTFPAAGDYVSIVSPTKGSVKLQKIKKDAKAARGEFLTAVSEMLVPGTTVHTMATRAGLVNSLFELEQYLSSFTDSSRFVIFGSRKIGLAKSSFQERSQKFFFCAYSYKGETINKKIAYESKGDSLSIVFDGSIFLVDGKPISPVTPDRLQLYYRNDKEKTSVLVGELKFLYIKP